MKIKPKKDILLIKKHKKFQISEDMIVDEIDEDKRLITGEVISNDNKEYPAGTTVIFGKYALFPLTIKGNEIFFLDIQDIIGVTDYTE